MNIYSGSSAVFIHAGKVRVIMGNIFAPRENPDMSIADLEST